MRLNDVSHIACRGPNQQVVSFWMHDTVRVFFDRDVPKTNRVTEFMEEDVLPPGDEVASNFDAISEEDSADVTTVSPLIARDVLNGMPFADDKG